MLVRTALPNGRACMLPQTQIPQAIPWSFRIDWCVRPSLAVVPDCLAGDLKLHPLPPIKNNNKQPIIFSDILERSSEYLWSSSSDLSSDRGHVANLVLIS